MNPNVFEQPLSNSIFETYWSPRTSELMVETGAQFIRFYVVHTSCHDKNVEMKIMHVSVLGPPILFTPFLSLPCSTDARSVASSTVETMLTIYFFGPSMLLHMGMEAGSELLHHRYCLPSLQQSSHSMYIT